MRKRGALTLRGLLELTIKGRENALAKARGKEAKAIEAELKDLRARLAAMPAEEAQ